MSSGGKRDTDFTDSHGLLFSRLEFVYDCDSRIPSIKPAQTCEIQFKKSKLDRMLYMDIIPSR